MSAPPVIGIDLGTTYSCVAFFKKGTVEVIANDHGLRTTPSYVAFNETERLVGQAAKDQAGINPQNTVFDVKRLMGRRFHDASVQEDIHQWPFKVVNDRNKILVELNPKGELRRFAPEQISSMILEKMRDIAKNYLGVQGNMKAVITVPAYFTNSQRQATRDAGIIAKLEVLRVINEPTAAGIAYGFKNNFSEVKNILVFDLGGGTFDVSILRIHDGVYQVLATAGDTHLGGEDFDTNVVNYCVQELKKTFKKDLSPKALYKLRRACEKAKRNLSENNATDIAVDSLIDGEDFIKKLSRAKFEELNRELFEKLEEPINKALEDANLSSDEIDSIVLVGGSSRISKVQEMIKMKFKDKEINKNIHPDEAVAYGAAIMGAYLNKDEHEQLQNFRLKDVIPLSLGTQIHGGLMNVLIRGNTTIPAESTTYLTTHQNEQCAISIVVYEGERKLVKDNNKLGQFILQGIAKAPRGVPKIEVKFRVNEDGILTVTALDTRNKLSKSIVISCDNGRLSEPEIRQMIQDAKNFEDDDIKERDRIRARLELEDYCLRIISIVTDTKNSPSEAIKATVIRNCQDMLDWLYDNEKEDIMTYETKLNDIRRKCDHMFAG